MRKEIDKRIEDEKKEGVLMSAKKAEKIENDVIIEEIEKIKEILSKNNIK